jgi:phosphoribosylaminoimidazolecarboxamide formyltransferase/IMP cyclohydrolase
VFYDEVLAALRENGTCSVALRRRLAAAVFRRTSGYDRAIATQLEREAGSLSAEEDGTGSARVIELERVHALRYGENPHQRATLYRPVGEVPRDLGAHTLIRGKALSYNNLLDLDTAIRLVRDLPGEVAACVVKHGTPCGAASGNDGATVFRAAHAGDPLSAFGGIVAVRPRLTGAVAEALLEEARFIECVAAPGFDDDAVALLSRRKTMRLVVCDPEPATGGSEVRSIAGGVLVQDTDSSTLHTEPFELQTDHPLSEAASRDLRFALACVKHARSNAITVASNGALLGCGSGHTSRVGAVRLALSHAGDKARGAVLASDAFFPFADSIDLCHEAGIAAIVEPGGSKRDAEVIAACERLGIALVFTGVRHFRH